MRVPYKRFVCSDWSSQSRDLEVVKQLGAELCGISLERAHDCDQSRWDYGDLGRRWCISAARAKHRGASMEPVYPGSSDDAKNMHTSC